MKVSQLLESYEDRVKKMVKLVADHFGMNDEERVVATQDAIKKAIAHYAAPKRDIAHHNWQSVVNGEPQRMIPNGFPDYNGSAHARNEFVRDVLAQLQGKYKRPLSGAVLDRPPAKPTLDQIWQEVEHAVGNMWPDNGPWEDSRFRKFVKQHNLTSDDIDDAVDHGLVGGNSGSLKVSDIHPDVPVKRERKVKPPKVGLHGYLAQMWDALAADVVADARYAIERKDKRLLDYESSYFTFEVDGKSFNGRDSDEVDGKPFNGRDIPWDKLKVVARDNPWQ